MGERIDASSSEPVHPLIEKALTSKVPIAELIGFDVEELGGGRAVASLRSGPQHANPMGTLHGGVLCKDPDSLINAMKERVPSADFLLAIERGATANVKP